MGDVQYWVIGGTLSLCAVVFFFILVPRYACRYGGSGKVPPLPRGNVPVAGLRLFDALGVGFFFGLYSMMWLASAMAEPGEIEVTPLLMSSELLVQGFMIGVVCMMLFWRVDLVEFLGLRWKKWYFGLLLAVPIVILMFSFNALLMVSGFDEWIVQLQGLEGPEDAQQEVVKMIKENDDPMLFVVLVILACVGAPLAEEVVFRGYIYPVVKRFSNIPVSILLTGLLFSAVHGNLAALIPLFVLGMALAAVYELTGSLWAPIAVHALFNTVSVVLMKLMVDHPEWFEEPKALQEPVMEVGWLLLMS